MNPRTFLHDALGTTQVPALVDAEKAIEAISAAILATSEHSTEFDADRLAPLLSALDNIQATSSDPLAVRVASIALQQFRDLS